MLLLDFGMQYEEKGERTRKRFTLHGDAPELRLDMNSFPYIHIQNGKMFEIVNGEAQPFTPRPKNDTGEPFSVAEVLQDLLMRIIRNETGIMELVSVNEIVSAYRKAFRGTIATFRTREIPYFIIFDKRFLKLVYATDRFLFYDDELEMPVMFRTDDGTLVSNNEFAEIGFWESVDAVKNGAESELEFKTYPDLEIQQFVRYRFPSQLGKDSAPTMGESEEITDVLPF